MLRRTLLPALALILLATVGACDKNYILVPGAGTTSPSSSGGGGTGGGGTPVPVVFHDKIEFRVLGNANSARIRHTSPFDGVTQVASAALPYTAQFDSTATSVFLSLDVSPNSYPTTVAFPFLQAQIWVNGVLFRETNSADFVLSTVSVSGTWRH